ncbi:MAG: COX15/CtaA family protein [Ignavibacteria bacterium]|nr:COX15/CtaA family protein [Ignavibacteria bacterium]
MEKSYSRKIIGYWLIAGLVMIYFQIVIGGITRLTGSGLSITEWNVMMGSLPPLSEAHWQELFNKYKQFPQFKIMNTEMTLSGFKNIFWWEYIHRLWARLFAIVFIIPFIYFIFKKWIDQKLALNLFFLFVFGAMQGLVGWIMVASGLKDNPWVNPLNLSIHLLLALFLFAFLLRLIIFYRKESEPISTFKMTRALNIFIALIAVQIFFGALMAGHKAALYYPTWPKIGEEWIPSNMNSISPAWLNIFENKAMIHFIHRNLAYLLAISLIVYWYMNRKINASSTFKLSFNLIPVAVLLQVFLGILTVINSLGSIPVVYGVLHQGVAIILLSLILLLRFKIAYSKEAELIESKVVLQ